jgi:hypothetical protein
MRALARGASGLSIVAFFGAIAASFGLAGPALAAAAVCVDDRAVRRQ